MRRLSAERGSAMVTAVLVTMLMLSVTISAISFVDTQTRESGRERKREATFQLSEGVLNTQIFLLSRSWPGTVATSFPAACTQANQARLECPDTTKLVSSFTGPDYSRGISWTSEVHDNAAGAANYYEDAVVRSQPTYDANQDSYMWVRAEGTLPDGRTRAIVALVKAEELVTAFPEHAVLAGSIYVGQMGNQEYINTLSSDGENGRLAVRCARVDGSDAGCLRWDPTKPHIEPADPEPAPGMADALTPEVIERLREHARAEGTYFAGGSADCPSSLTGTIVFIENATGCSAYDGNKAVYNPTGLGVLIIGSGEFTLSGPNYNGLIYHVNGSDGVGPPTDLPKYAVTLKNNSVVTGAVIVDGQGGLFVGNNSGGAGFDGNIIFDGNANTQLRAFGTAGIVQNSFREIYATGGGY